jgi:hypothetical protein
MPTSLKVFLFCWFTGFGVQFIRRRDPRIIKLLLVSVACVIGLFGAGFALAIVGGMTPKYDLWLFKADWALGSPAYWISRMIVRTPLYVVLVLVYDTMPAVLLLVYAAHLLWRGIPGHVLAAFALNFGAGFCLYLLLPACGPIYAFPSFPWVLPPFPELQSLSISSVPNCMPSIHASTALLALAFCWRWPGVRAAALLNVALTLLGTLASGEHYLIDLVVAVPYAAFVYAAVNRHIRSAAAWLALVLVWIAGLRLGLPWITPAPLPFACACVATVVAVVASTLLHRKTSIALGDADSPESPLDASHRAESATATLISR